MHTEKLQIFIITGILPDTHLNYIGNNYSTLEEIKLNKVNWGYTILYKDELFTEIDISIFINNLLEILQNELPNKMFDIKLEIITNKDVITQQVAFAVKDADEYIEEYSVNCPIIDYDTSDSVSVLLDYYDPEKNIFDFEMELNKDDNNDEVEVDDFDENFPSSFKMDDETREYWAKHYENHINNVFNKQQSEKRFPMDSDESYFMPNNFMNQISQNGMTEKDFIKLAQKQAKNKNKFKNEEDNFISNAIKKSKNPKKEIKKYNIIISTKKAIRKDRKRMEELLEYFITGNSNWEQAWRKKMAKRFINSYAISKKKANKLKDKCDQQNKKEKNKRGGPDWLNFIKNTFTRSHHNDFYDPSK